MNNNDDPENTKISRITRSNQTSKLTRSNKSGTEVQKKIAAGITNKTQLLSCGTQTLSPGDQYPLNLFCCPVLSFLFLLKKRQNVIV